LKEYYSNGKLLSEDEKQFLIDYFEHKTVTHNAVVEAYNKLVGDK